MRLAIRVLVLILLSNALLIGNTQGAFSCQCMWDDPPLPDALADSDVVFAGRAIAIAEGKLGPKFAFRPVFHTMFQVHQVWKGGSTPVMFVTSARDLRACGYVFEQDVEYLVYAYEMDELGGGGLHTGICTRTMPLNAAQADIAALGAGQTVANTRADIPSLMPWIVGGVVVVLVLAAVIFGSGLVMIRRKES
jgi:hypothetical protein